MIDNNQTSNVTRPGSCPNCAADVPESAKFCMECGTALRKQPSTAPPSRGTTIKPASDKEVSAAATNEPVKPRRLKRLKPVRRLNPVRPQLPANTSHAVSGQQPQPPAVQPRIQRLVPRKQPTIVVAGADQSHSDDVISLSDASGRIGINDVNQATDLLDEWMEMDWEGEAGAGPAQIPDMTETSVNMADTSAHLLPPLTPPAPQVESAEDIVVPESAPDIASVPAAPVAPPAPVHVAPPSVPAPSQPLIAPMPPAASAPVTPMEPQPNVAVSKVEIEAPREAPPVKLPHPTDTGAGEEQLKETSEEIEASDPADDKPDRDDTQAQIARQKSAAALRKFKELAEKAKAAQRKKQEPIPDKLPGSLKRNIDRLAKVKADDPEDMASQIRKIGQSQSPCAIDAVKARLSRKNNLIRVACAEALGAIPHALSVVALIELLSDSSPEVVDAATRGLLESGQGDIIPLLLCLSAANPRVRSTVREHIQEISEELQQRYVDALLSEANRGEDPDMAAFALNIIALIRGEEFLKAIAQFTSHKRPELRIAAAEALAATGTNHAARHVNVLFKDKVAAVRVAAAASLANVRNPKSEKLLITALRDSDSKVRMTAARTLTNIEHEDLAPAAHKALAKESDPGTIEYLLEIIGKAGDSTALKTLEKFLKGEDIELRLRAISTLRRLKEKKSAPLVAPFLEDQHAETRMAAIKTIGLLGDLSVAATLRKMVSGERGEDFRAAAARALGDLRDRNSLNVLAEALHDGRAVRCQALIAMGQIGHESAVPEILTQLRDQAPEVRYHACNALGEIGKLANPAPLKEMLNDRERMVRRAAEAALTKLGVSTRQAKAANVFKKVAASLVPSAIAGAIPGGAKTLVGVVAAMIGAGIWFGAAELVPSAPDFPIRNVKAIGISPDGNQVTISRVGRVLEVWDTSTGELSTQFKSKSDGTSILYQKNGNALLLSPGKTMQIDSTQVADVQDEAIKPSPLKKVDAFRVAFNSDRSRVLVCSRRGDAALVDLVSGQEVESYKLKDFTERCALTMSPDEKLCFIGNAKGRLIIYSLEEKKLKGNTEISRLIKVPETGISSMAIDESGTYLAVGTTTGRVVVIELNGLRVAGNVFEGKGIIPALRFGKSSQLVFVTQQGKLHKAKSDFSGSEELQTSLPGIPEQISFSADGMTAAASFSESKQFLAVSFDQDRILAQYPLPN